MELLNSIFHFFTDKTKKLPHKVILFLLAVLLIAILDNILSFSFSYNIKNKIEQIEGVNKILADTTLSKSEKNKLLVLRENILTHSTWKDKTFDFLTSINFNNSDITGNHKHSIKQTVKYLEKLEIRKTEKSRNYLWHFISSGWIFIILIIAFPIIGFFDKNTPFIQAIGIIIVVEPLLYGICWIYAKVFSYIPIILDEPIFNYILNAILCAGSFYLFSLLQKNKK